MTDLLVETKLLLPRPGRELVARPRLVEMIESRLPRSADPRLGACGLRQDDTAHEPGGGPSRR